MRRLFTTTTLYTVAGLIGPLVALLLTPMYIDAIGVAGYGIVDVLHTIVQLLIPLALWGVPTTMIGRVAVDAKAPHQHGVLRAAVWLVVLVSIVISSVTISVSPILALAMQRPDVQGVLVIYAVSLPFAAVHGVVLAMMRLLGLVWRVVLLMVTYVGVLALSRVLLVVWGDAGAYGMIEALALTNAVVACLSIGVSWRWWWGGVDWSVVRQFGRLGLPLLPASVAVWVLLFVDRWFLVRHVTPLEQGQYAVAALIASLMAFVAEPFKQAWQPIARVRSQALFARWSLTLYTVVALLMGAVIVVLSPEVLMWLGGRDAVAASEYLFWLIIAPLLSGAVAVVSMPAIRAQRTVVIAWATLTGAAVNIVLNIVLIPAYGVHGAAWATAGAALIIPLMHVWLNHRIEPIAYDWVRVMGLLGLWVVFGLATVSMTFFYRVVAFGVLMVAFGILIRIWRWRTWVAVWRGMAQDEHE